MWLYRDIFIYIVLFHIIRKIEGFLYTAIERTDFYQKLEMFLYVRTYLMTESAVCNLVNVVSNVSLVVDVQSFDDPNDLKADENGVWERKGSLI